MQQATKLKAYTALSFAVLFWGTSYVGTKVALESFPPLILAFLRFFVAGALFGSLLLLKGWPRMPSSFHKKILSVAFFLPGLYFVFENFGVKYTTATKASLIAATIPVVVLMLSVAVIGEKLTRRRVISLVLSLGGVALLVFHGEAAQNNVLKASTGDLLMVGAVFSAAIYMILVRKMSEDYSSLVVTAFQMIYGALFFAPFFIVQGVELNWAEVGTRQWGALLVLVLLATIGAFFAYNYALQVIAASRAALFINVVPFVTAFASWMMLGECLTAIQMAGGALVIMAAVLANSSTQQPEAEKSERTPGGSSVSANIDPV